MCGAAFEQQVSTSQQETAAQQEMVTELKAQLCQANSQRADEIKKKDETINHKVRLSIVQTYMYLEYTRDFCLESIMPLNLPCTCT